LGFYGASGTIREGVVYYGDGVGKRKGRLTFGELSGQSNPRLESISAVFQSVGIPVVSCANMDAWLKTHAALILPIAGALYLAGGDTLHLANDRTALAWMVRRNMTIVYCQCPILG